jgi:hypothetical protein
MLRTYKHYRNAARFCSGHVVAVNGGKAFASAWDVAEHTVLAEAAAAMVSGNGSIHDRRFDRVFVFVEFASGDYGFGCRLSRPDEMFFEVYKTYGGARAHFDSTVARYGDNPRWSLRTIAELAGV